jgi:predicted ATPase/transcriptional regulator with XRE-family HTH domain
MDPPTSFGLWLRQRRKELDLTREVLAGCVGCSVSTLRKLEDDERRPSRQMAELLAGCLEIAPENRAAFLKIARAELSIDQLQNVKTLNVGRLKVDPSLAAFAPPRLPVSPTPLIGREHELATIAGLLQNSQCRLLTLTGPGGIGKSRLAMAVASAEQANFEHGVCFAALAALNTAEFIIPAIADAIGFTFYGPMEPQVQLLSYLREKQVLLVLDNFEHLLAPAQEGLSGQLFHDLLHQAPAIKLLVTSRERLNLQGEWVFEVQGLPVPPPGQKDNWESYSAVALFLRSARRTQLDFEVKAGEWPFIMRICQLLEGMPLGIELAASWVRLLSCQEIAQQIEHDLDFLATSLRDAPERHRSLRAAFDHSWKLLLAEEQRVMEQLSVFQGGFRREAAEQVAGASLLLLSALADKSLLRRAGNGRYDLHELMRQYAQANLHKNPTELAAVQDRHSAYYMDFIQQREERLKGPRQAEALAELTAEIDNIRLGWRRAVGHQQEAINHKVLKTLWYFYEIRGWFHEAEAAFGWAVAELEQIKEADRQTEAAQIKLREFIRALHGWFCLRLGQQEKSRVLLQHSLAQLRALEAQVELAHMLHHIGVLEWSIGNYQQARVLFQEELALCTQNNDLWGAALSHGNLGLVAQMLGEYEEARERMQQAIAIYRALGDKRMVAIGLNFLGGVEAMVGDYTQAYTLLRESLTLNTALGERWSYAMTLNQLGLAAQAQGEYAEAQYLFQECIALFRNMGEKWWSMTRALNNLGNTTCALGDYAAARDYFVESFRTAIESQLIPHALDALVGLAEVQAHEGAGESALELLWHVLRHPASTQEAKARAERLQADLKINFTPPQIETLQEQGQGVTFEMLVEKILLKK